jgi:hypothetical protein
MVRLSLSSELIASKSDAYNEPNLSAGIDGLPFHNRAITAVGYLVDGIAATAPDPTASGA